MTHLVASFNKEFVNPLEIDSWQRMGAYLQTHTHKYVHTHTQMHIHLVWHLHWSTCVHIQSHARPAYKYIYTYIHTYTYTYIYLRPYVRTYIHTLRYTRRYTRRYILAYIHTYIHKWKTTEISAKMSKIERRRDGNGETGSERQRERQTQTQTQTQTRKAPPVQHSERAATKAILMHLLTPWPVEIENPGWGEVCGGEERSFCKGQERRGWIRLCEWKGGIHFVAKKTKGTNRERTKLRPRSLRCRVSTGQ